MDNFLAFFCVFWLLKSLKSIFFYVYLWQLKEYQVKRFLSHFQTEKGRRLVLNKILIFKIAAVVALIGLALLRNSFNIQPFFVFLAALFLFSYIFEVFSGIRNLFKGTLKLPKITIKTAVLLFFNFLIFGIIFLKTINISGSGMLLAIFLLVLADIFSPVIISLVVLVFQPLFVFYRNQFILKRAAEKIAKRTDLIVIGVTGSFGKTSVKEFLSAVLSSKFKVLKTSSHQNSEVGISNCILSELSQDHQVFVVEMGAYGRGGIKLLGSIAKPRIGILTGINSQHISLFGSQEEIVKTKYELIECLPKTGLALFNGENEFCRELYKKTEIHKKIYGDTGHNETSPDIWAENINIYKDRVEFLATFKGAEKIPIKAKVLGRHNILNILPAILIAKILGLTREEIIKGVENIRPDQGALKIINGKSDPYFIDSTYSSNFDGVIADLEYLNVWPGKKAIIMPCIIELGEKAKEIHREIGKKIAKVCSMAIITTGEYYGDIKAEAIKNGMEENNIVCLDDTEQILSRIKIFANPNDVILLEGRLPEKLLKSITN